MKNQKFPEAYGDRGTKAKFERAKKYYNDEKIVEAFSLLYAVIEIELSATFKMFLHDFLSIKLYEELDFLHDWEYPQLIRVLSELRILSNSDYQKFVQFQRGRHKAIHELPFAYLHEKLNMKTLDSSFKAGIKSHEIIWEKLGEIYNKNKSKIDFSNSAEKQKFQNVLEEVLKRGYEKRLI